MGDLFATILAVATVVIASSAGLAFIALPFYVLFRLGGKLPKRKRNIKEEIVRAQWEYDRTWKKGGDK